MFFSTLSNYKNIYHLYWYYRYYQYYYGLLPTFTIEANAECHLKGNELVKTEVIFIHPNSVRDSVQIPVGWSRAPG